ncbi:SDR family NAD(P)-dependent oxidoreductase [Streptomyces sp. NPDC004788]
MNAPNDAHRTPRRVVISGGGTGIGLVTAEDFAAAGDEVIIIGRREDVLRDAAAAVNKRHDTDRVSWIRADLSLPADTAEAAARISGDGPVDVIVTNAGGNVAPDAGDTLEQIADGYLRNFKANTLTAVLLTEALLPAMRRPGGRVVHLSSIAAVRGPGSYGGSKAALHAYVYELAQRVGAEGITVNAVAPGYVADTEFFGERATPAFVASRVDATLTKQGGTPQEVSAAIRYLCSPEAAYVHGQILHINGGAMLGR